MPIDFAGNDSKPSDRELLLKLAALDEAFRFPECLPRSAIAQEHLNVVFRANRNEIQDALPAIAEIPNYGPRLVTVLEFLVGIADTHEPYRD